MTSETSAPPKLGEVFNPHGEFYGSCIPDPVMKLQNVSAVAKLHYGRLLRYAGKHGKAWPHQKTLADELGCSSRTSMRALEELDREKLITRRPPTAAERRIGGSTVYEFLWHTCFEGARRWKNGKDEEVPPPKAPTGDKVSPVPVPTGDTTASTGDNVSPAIYEGCHEGCHEVCTSLSTPTLTDHDNDSTDRVEHQRERYTGRSSTEDTDRFGDCLYHPANPRGDRSGYNPNRSLCRSCIRKCKAECLWLTTEGKKRIEEEIAAMGEAREKKEHDSRLAQAQKAIKDEEARPNVGEGQRTWGEGGGGSKSLEGARCRPCP